MGEQAVAAPFQMPVAPVAGFTPFQQQYFNEIAGMQGMSQPYFNLGQQYLQGSAAPVSGQDVANYYNPMAQNVFANLQNVFGQQMQETTGGLTQQAGGVGADRIAVGQADLAKQQGLAAGQTAAGLYQQALQAAEQQKQMMAGAGYGIAQMGPAAQAAALQGIGALGGAGAQQQQLTQAQLNALYQNQLARIAYPFQTAQYLAGITGGLAPAMGGTTAGYGTTTAPAPTLGAQLLGVGTGALGLIGGTGGFGQGGWFSNMFNPMQYQSAPNWQFNRGGSTPNPFAEGGEVIPFPMQGSPDDFLIWNENVDKSVQKHLARRNPQAQATRSAISRALGGIGNIIPFHPLDPRSPASGGDLTPVFQAGGSADEQDSVPPIPSVALPKTGGLSPIPFTSLPMGSGEFHNRLNLSPQVQQQSTSGKGSGLGGILKTAIGIGSMFANRGGTVENSVGGSVEPEDIGRGFATEDDAGFLNPFADSASVSTGHQPTQLAFNRDASIAGNTGDILGRAAAITKQQESGGDYGNVTTTRNKQGQPQSAIGAYGIMDFNVGPWTKEVLGKPMTPEQFRNDPAAQDAVYRAKMGQYISQYGIEGAGRVWLGGPGGVNNPLATDALGTSVGSYGQRFAQGLGSASPMAAPNVDMSGARYMLPTADRPYPGALEQDVGQRMARSPWMALVAAGAQMAQTRGPIGSVIGAGMGAGAKELEGQRKELRSEQEINMKAQQLYQQAQMHLDAYERIPAAKQAELGIAREKLEQEAWRPTGTVDISGNPLLFNAKTGETKAVSTIGAGTGEASPANVSAYDWAKNNPDNPRAAGLLGDAERYLKTGTLPANMGRGTQGMQEAQRIRSIAYQMAAERGIPADELPKQWQQFRSEQTAITRFMSGPQGNTARSLNVVTDHAETLRNLGTALQNGNIQLFNRVAQAWAQQTGHAPPTNFDMAKDIVGTELIKALGVAGAGSEAERAHLGERISRASSPEQLNQAIDSVVRPLLGGQLRGLRQQFKTSTGLPEDRFNEMLFPKTRQFLESAESPASTAPQEGERRQFKQGWGVYRNGRWIPETP